MDAMHTFGDEGVRGSWSLPTVTSQLFLLYLISHIYIDFDLYSGLPAHASSCFFALSSVLVHCRAASGVSTHGVETC